MKRYNKAIDYALLTMHYARKAEMSKTAAVKASFRKKAIEAALNSGKQADTLEGMKTLEASLRIAAENEGMLPPVEDEMNMEEDMLMEAEDEMLDDVDMDIQEVDAEAEDDEDEDVEKDVEDDEDEDEEDSDDEAVEAFNRVAARVRARRLAARKLQARKLQARKIQAAKARKAMARRLAARRAAR